MDVLLEGVLDSWGAGEVRALPLGQLSERYRRYRLSSPEGEEEMVRSLRRWGQLAPITVWVRFGDKGEHGPSELAARLAQARASLTEMAGCSTIGTAFRFRRNGSPARSPQRQRP